MKKSVLFLISTLLITTFFSLQQATAQDNKKEDQEKEQNIQKAIEEQKKAMVEQKNAQEETLQDLQKQEIELDNLKNINVQVQVDAEKAADDAAAQVKRVRRFHFEGPNGNYFTEPQGDQFFWHPYAGDNESTTWEYSRSVKERSLKNEYSFDVDKSANSVVMAVNGDCKAGEIRIKIITPGGKTYSDIVIDEFGNLNWRKSFTLADNENQDKAGEWKFQISSNKATGYFKISLQTY